MEKSKTYDEFLKDKLIVAPESGFDVAPETMNKRDRKSVV